MSKKLKAIIPSVLLVASITGGTYYYTHNNNPIDSTSSNLLYYSSSDLNRASIELVKLKVRTYSDLDWYELGGREKLFGGWLYYDRYGIYNLPSKCKVNNAILIIQSIEVSFTDKCNIIAGKWQSSYTNNFIYTKSDIQIDHIVPVKNVWDSGGNMWTNNQRVKYYNSDGNLIISEKTLNQSKGNKSPDKWLPPENKCGYIVKWIDIKFEYKLTVTNLEKQALAQEIKTCN